VHGGKREELTGEGEMDKEKKEDALGPIMMYKY